MTLIIGMYYDNKKGALIASDSIIVKGNFYRKTQKIFSFKNLAMADGGLVWASNELTENLEEILTKNIPIKKAFRKAQERLFENFCCGENPISCEAEMPAGICGFYIDHPKLFRFYERNIEFFDDFEAVGVGEDDAENILKKYYRQDISKENAMDIAILSIIESSNNNINIDDNPQIVLIDKSGCNILNYDEKGNFDFYKPEIVQIKKKMNELYRYNNSLFEILLDEKNSKRKRLIDLLNE